MTLGCDYVYEKQGNAHIIIECNKLICISMTINL